MPSKRQAGFALIGMSVAVFLAPGVVVAILSGLAAAQDEEVDATVYMPIVFATWAASVVLFRLGWRLRASTAAVAMAKDRRSPILLLRSFNDDGMVVLRANLPIWDVLDKVFLKRRRTLQEVLNAKLKKHGPTVEIANPKATVPHLGFSGETVGNDQWEERVPWWIAQAQLIVMIMGATDGVMKEWCFLVTAGALSRTLLVLPPVSEKILARRWRNFVQEAQKRSGLCLPNDLPRNAVMIAFSNQMNCRVFTGRRLLGRLFPRRHGDYEKALRALR